MRKHYLQQAFSSDNGNGELAIRHDLEWHAQSARQGPQFLHAFAGVVSNFPMRP